MSADRGSVERRALALMERLVGYPGNARFRARLLRDESAEVLVRVARLEAIAGAEGCLPTELGEVADGADARPPERFGAFRITEMIGHGGMGDVWRGQRDDGVFEQTVAIKLIRVHLQAQAGAAFEAERRILARLDHPNIVRLIDGGMTEDGRPCLVMDYVPGVSFDIACAGLPLKVRLKLFSEAAAAVHYAHGCLIAHGDLKPSNILVDAEGRVRLLDFGIARLITDEAGDGAATGAMTSGFASPSRLAGAAPSIQDDVFALGRLLGVVVAADGDDDLLAIVGKATADDEDIRYGSVAELNRDIDRWHRRFPVTARPPTFSYRARLFLRRQWKAVLAVGVLAVTAIFALGAVVSSERERADAGARFEDTRGIARYLLFTLYDQLEAQPDSLGLRREVAGTAQHYLDRLASSRSPQAVVRVEAAQGLMRLAQVQGSPMVANLGEPEAARRNLQTALSLLQGGGASTPSDVVAQAYLDSAYLAEFVEEDPGRARRDAELALSMGAGRAAKPERLASYYVLDAVLEQWDQHYAVSVASAARAEDALINTNSLEGLILRAKASELRGDALWYGGDPAGSVPAYRASVAILESAIKRFPSDMYALRRLGHARWALASALADTGAVKAGLAQIEESSRELQRVVAFDKADDDARRHLHITENARGGILVQAGQVDQGLRLLAQTVDERRAIWQAHPEEARRRRDYAVELKPLADLQAEHGRVAQACLTWAEARRVFELMDRAGRLTDQDREDQLGNILKSQKKYCG